MLAAAGVVIPLFHRLRVSPLLGFILVGMTVGGGLAGSGLVGTRVLRSGHPWPAVALTAAAEFGLIFVAIFVFVGVSLGIGFGATGPCGR